MSGHNVNATHSGAAAQMLAHAKSFVTVLPSPPMFCMEFLPLQKLFPSNLMKVAFTLVVVRVSANKEASSKRLNLVAKTASAIQFISSYKYKRLQNLRRKNKKNVPGKCKQEKKMI